MVAKDALLNLESESAVASTSVRASVSMGRRAGRASREWSAESLAEEMDAERCGDGGVSSRAGNCDGDAAARGPCDKISASALSVGSGVVASAKGTATLDCSSAVVGVLRGRPRFLFISCSSRDGCDVEKVCSWAMWLPATLHAGTHCLVVRPRGRMREPHGARRNGLINARERRAILCLIVEAYRQRARQWRGRGVADGFERRLIFLMRVYHSMHTTFDKSGTKFKGTKSRESQTPEIH